MLHQFLMMYMVLGLMYSAMILSNPDEQVKTELLLAGMEIPPEKKESFKLMIALIMMLIWPLDMFARSKL